MSTSSPTPLDVALEALRDATRRYRAHASRDAAWVQAWTGQADPELEEIESLIEQLVQMERQPDDLELLCDRLLALQDEPILAQAMSEALLATPPEQLAPVILERAIAIVQDLDEPPPAASPWLAQVLFWSARSIDDLELCVVLLGSSEVLCRALPLWLMMPRGTSPHVITRHPKQALAWLDSLSSQLDDDTRHEPEIIQALALAHGMTHDLIALPALLDLLDTSLSACASPEDRQEPDVGIDACLQAFAALPVSDDPRLISALMRGLGTPAHGDSCVPLCVRIGEPCIDALEQVLHEQTSLSWRTRALRTLKQMPLEFERVDEVLYTMTRDGVAPIRHTALYALVARENSTILEHLDTLIREEEDALEAEELLFILASSSSERSNDFISELATTELPSSLSSELFDEALAT